MEHIADIGIIIGIAAGCALMFGTFGLVTACVFGLGFKAVRSR